MKPCLWNYNQPSIKAKRLFWLPWTLPSSYLSKTLHWKNFKAACMLKYGMQGFDKSNYKIILTTLEQWPTSPDMHLAMTKVLIPFIHRLIPEGKIDMEKLNITAKLVVCWSTASLNNIASTKREPFITMKRPVPRTNMVLKYTGINAYLCMITVGSSQHHSMWLYSPHCCRF